MCHNVKDFFTLCNSTFYFTIGNTRPDVAGGFFCFLLFLLCCYEHCVNNRRNVPIMKCILPNDVWGSSVMQCYWETCILCRSVSLTNDIATMLDYTFCGYFYRIWLKCFIPVVCMKQRQSSLAVCCVAGAPSSVSASASRGHGDEGGYCRQTKRHHVPQDIYPAPRKRQVRRFCTHECCVFVFVWLIVMRCS